MGLKITRNHTSRVERTGSLQAHDPHESHVEYGLGVTVYTVYSVSMLETGTCADLVELNLDLSSAIKNN